MAEEALFGKIIGEIDEPEAKIKYLFSNFKSSFA